MTRRRRIPRAVAGRLAALPRALLDAELYLQVAPAFLVVLDRDARVQLVNDYGCAVLGRSRADLVGRDWYEHAVALQDRERLRTAYLEIVRGRRRFHEHVESRVITSSGEERVVSWRRTLLHDRRGRILGTLSAGEDVTERRRAELALEHLRLHDPLTGLPNRLQLEERLGAAVVAAEDGGEAAGLLYIDLDDFGLVNDSLGHGGGDALLRAVAHRLRDRATRGELVARHGGDEFLVLLEGLPRANAQDVMLAAADRFAGALDAPFTVGATEIEVRAAVGVSVLPGDAGSGRELLAHADAAMYQAKRTGGGPRPYAREAVPAVERMTLARRLRRALEHDELSVHLQPIIDLRSGASPGGEALVRWREPGRGLVPPAAFIPFAERSGLIEAVGRRVLEKVCEALVRAGPNGWISINVSTRELALPGFAGSVAETLDHHGLDAEALVVEVTESAVSHEPERAGATLAALRALGVRLAIDDFGAGYSSLARLRELPVDVLKIDAGFLRDVPHDGDAAAMLRAIVELARSLGLQAVAEGVETDSQRELLERLGCPLAQGFLLGRPRAPHHGQGEPVG